MKKVTYGLDTILQHFPEILDQAKEGHVVVSKIVTNDGRLVARVVHFPNTSIFTPDDYLKRQIEALLLHDCIGHIRTKRRGSRGISFVGRPPMIK
ncbi:MAG TPA: hypothetical protein VL335_00695 [Candidatus Paceibacterota bacterium]|jgi:antitoxin (DNA-binding transcriptional repressor) of toxin-antitoxin stability system|nr:hypothetical protein [Candidatus Paceibacterota bacterium]